MSASTITLAFVCSTLCIQLALSQQQSRHNQYAHILQDTRNEPTPDGTFGYLYKTEDGIVSSARGDPSGVIHGTFSYTDPTGLRVNYNYNAGSRFTPGYKYNSLPTDRQTAPADTPKRYTNSAASPASRGRQPESEYQDEPQYYREPDQDEYAEPPQSAPKYITRPQNSYRNAGDVYQQRRSRPQPVNNDLYEDSNYRG